MRTPRQVEIIFLEKEGATFKMPKSKKVYLKFSEKHKRYHEFEIAGYSKQGKKYLSIYLKKVKGGDINKFGLNPAKKAGLY